MNKTREHNEMASGAVKAVQSAVDSFNRVHDPFKIETCLVLLTISWELVAKAILLKRKIEISKDAHGNTISAEVAVSKIRSLGLLDENQEDCIQQVISLRNYAVHGILPLVPEEILHHLFYFCCKFFKDVIARSFPAYLKHLRKNFLSISFSDLTTYADKAQKLIGRFKKSKQDRKLVWLLERGIKFEGTNYISQDKFEKEYLQKKRVLPHLGVGKFLKSSEMVRVVAIQAPRNYTADISLRKGGKVDSSLPVVIKKTETETDYPYLTSELGLKVNKNSNWIAKIAQHLGFKGNPRYHQKIRVSKSGVTHRYSDVALNDLKVFMAQNPEFNPWHLPKMEGATV
jgi:hypothetical protein